MMLDWSEYRKPQRSGAQMSARIPDGKLRCTGIEHGDVEVLDVPRDLELLRDLLVDC
jgi:hypothetical protein